MKKSYDGVCEIADVLGIARMTLYRWDKVVSLPRSKFRTTYGIPRIERMTVDDIIKWVKELEEALKNSDSGRQYYLLREVISRLKAACSGV